MDAPHRRSDREVRDPTEPPMIAVVLVGVALAGLVGVAAYSVIALALA